MGFICSGYNSIKSQVIRSRRKQLPPGITTFDEIPNESKYYKTKSNENFMIFKNNDLIYATWRNATWRNEILPLIEYKIDINKVDKYDKYLTYIASILSNIKYNNNNNNKT
ncbi:hypothetical protein LY90DRAFT_504589 [Neocallimastix californiae]|uniref:Uncharacterized protein n=1 Tax=Neocallimastix californiae TaxID=1754190 RepID=A0A1Y2E8P0_9FUNG|nr:hypothetical protein LY90DRAFT_504589 [Neocallimastix californiae]|eukprot:ORY67902.1 hypothetical protein LY90DRAFT_504589 [Neocallimastix californiae]